MKRVFSILAMVAALAAGPVVIAKPFTADDLVRLPRVGGPVLSPDGSQIVFTLRSTDMEADKGRFDLWLVDTDGESEPKQLTSHEANDTSPRWSVDSTSIYFLSSRGGSSQVWKIATNGGEARQVSDYPLDVAEFKLSPTEDRLLLAISTYPDCQDLECSAKRSEQQAERKTSGVVYEQLFIRHWDRWLDPTRSRLYSAPLADGKAGVVSLLSKVDADVPSRPFGGAEEFNFSADGQTVYFTARLRDANEAWSTNFDIYAIPASGDGQARNITAGNRAWDTQPVASPDGRYLAWLAMKRPGFEADQFELMLRDLRSGETRSVTDNWDRSPSGFVWSHDASQIIANATDVGHKTLWAIEPASGAVSKLTQQGYIGSFDVGVEQLVFARDDLSSPAELFSADLSGDNIRQLTRLSQPALADIDFGEYEQFSFPGWNDETVHGFVVKPHNYQPGKKYPIAFLIHGGPQGSFSNHFHYRWNPQTYAGQGYAAVMIDFHGSTGYGQTFTDSISGDWGGKPLEDLQKGLAAAVDRYDFLDRNKACALGASFGGYMVNWIAGNWPQRFDCLVNHDGVFDQRAMYYTTEELWFVEWENGGPHYLQPGNYESANPVNHVEKWRTPMLVVQGELDYRVPIGQGLATFTALQRKGIDSKFLYYPDENHWVLKPNNSVQWHQEVNAWLAKYLN